MTKPGRVTTYADPSDMTFAPGLFAAAPVEAKAFTAFKTVAEWSDGVIPAKYRELIALGVALTTQCSYCLDVHTRQALEAGATREELGETIFIAAALRRGGRGSRIAHSENRRCRRQAAMRMTLEGERRRWLKSISSHSTDPAFVGKHRARAASIVSGERTFTAVRL